MSGNHAMAARARRVLAEDAVVQMRQRFSEGERITFLSWAFGVSRFTVSSVVYGRTYRDCGGPIRGPRP
jgi:hypothetical protein